MKIIELDKTYIFDLLDLCKAIDGYKIKHL